MQSIEDASARRSKRFSEAGSLRRAIGELSIWYIFPLAFVSKPNKSFQFVSVDLHIGMPIHLEFKLAGDRKSRHEPRFG